MLKISMNVKALEEVKLFVGEIVRGSGVTEWEYFVNWMSI